MTPVLRYDINKIATVSLLTPSVLSQGSKSQIYAAYAPIFTARCTFTCRVLASPAFFRMLSGSSSAAIFLMLRQSIGHAAWRSTVSGKTAIQTVWRKHRLGSGKASALRTASENAAPTAQAISPARARSRAGRKDTRELFAAEFSGRVRGCQRFNAFDRV